MNITLNVWQLIIIVACWYILDAVIKGVYRGIMNAKFKNFIANSKPLDSRGTYFSNKFPKSEKAEIIEITPDGKCVKFLHYKLYPSEMGSIKIKKLNIEAFHKKFLV